MGPFKADFRGGEYLVQTRPYLNRNPRACIWDPSKSIFRLRAVDHSHQVLIHIISIYMNIPTPTHPHTHTHTHTHTHIYIFNFHVDTHKFLLRGSTWISQYKTSQYKTPVGSAGSSYTRGGGGFMLTILALFVALAA
jgi:hypothetical protein